MHIYIYMYFTSTFGRKRLNYIRELQRLCYPLQNPTTRKMPRCLALCSQANSQVAEMYKHNRELFVQTAKYWTETFAAAKRSSNDEKAGPQRSRPSTL